MTAKFIPLIGFFQIYLQTRPPSLTQNYITHSLLYISALSCMLYLLNLTTVQWSETIDSALLYPIASSRIEPTAEKKQFKWPRFLLLEKVERASFRNCGSQRLDCGAVDKENSRVQMQTLHFCLFNAAKETTRSRGRQRKKVLLVNF